MEKLLLKIFELINKPVHYFLIGCFCILWNHIIEQKASYIMFAGIILVLLSLASLIEYLYHQIQKRHNNMIIAKKTAEQDIKEKNNIFVIYENLPRKEKAVIDSCLNQRYPVYQGEPEDTPTIVSLCSAGLGTYNRDCNTFIMNPKIFDYLTGLSYENKVLQ